MTKLLELLKTLAVSLAGVATVFAAQALLTPQQRGFVLIAGLIIGLLASVAQLFKRTFPRHFRSAGPLARHSN